MPEPIIKQFVVEGSTAHPVAILDTDLCWPARAADAAADYASDADARRKLFSRRPRNMRAIARAGSLLAGA
ncbi:hypothetical protein [Sphingomonas insulae]|nr:hypothetical protein [Sphingomonas insulae]